MASLIKTAWAENPSLAVQIAFRFTSPQIRTQVRALLVSHPEKAMKEPDALQILLDSGLPHDVSSQLKVCPLLCEEKNRADESAVSAILGSRQPNYSSHILLTGIW